MNVSNGHTIDMISPAGSLLFGKGQSFSTVAANITRRKVSSEDYDFEKLLLLCF